jgi:Domain of unknown function (DUF4389)
VPGRDIGRSQGSFLWLLTDKYPSTDEEQAVHLDIPYPDVQKDLKAGLPLVKWLLAIPHYICLIGLVIGAVVVVIIAWFAILFTGKYPQGLFNFVVGVMRWGLRVENYAILLTTDIYPPLRWRRTCSSTVLQVQSMGGSCFINVLFGVPKKRIEVDLLELSMTGSKV